MAVQEAVAAFDGSGDVSHLIKALTCYENAISSQSSDNSQHPHISSGLARYHYWRAQATQDVDLAIHHYTAAFDFERVERSDANRDLDTVERFMELKAQAELLRLRYREQPNTVDLNWLIERYKEARYLLPLGDDRLREVLHDLGELLLVRFQTGEHHSKDADRAISCYSEASSMSRNGSEPDARSLRGVVAGITYRYRRHRRDDDLDRLAECSMRMVGLGPSVITASDMGTFRGVMDNLWERFQKRGEVTDRNQGIEFAESLITLYPPAADASERAQAIRKLAINLDERFRRTGDLGDSNRAVALREQLLRLRPEGHPDHPDAVRELAIGLNERLRRTGDLGDSNRAVALSEQLLRLRPEGHPDHPDAVRVLAASLHGRFRRTGDLGDSNRAIALLEQLLRLRPEGHPDHPDAVRSLAISLQERFQRTGDLGDSNRAIAPLEQLLRHRPEGHPEHPDAVRLLAISLDERFHCTGDLGDSNRAVALKEQLLQLRPEGHPNHPDAVWLLAFSFKRRFRRTGDPWDLTQSFDHYRKCLSYSYTPVLDRLSFALGWVDLAQNGVHELQTEPYVEVLRLLDVTVSQSTSLEMRCSTLSQLPLVRKARHMANNAAAQALNQDRANLAVDLLEQGRSVVFRQLRHLRAKLDKLQSEAPDLATSFQALSHQLEQHTVTTSLRVSGLSTSRTLNLEQADAEYHQSRRYAELSRDWSVIVERIRQIPAFGTFLKPQTYYQLRKAAESGPVIVINISMNGSHGIIVTRDLEEPFIVPLPDATPDCVARLADSFSLRPAELNSKTAIGLLRDVWDVVVGPVAEALRSPPLNVPKGSRIWWCPTGHAARLPLHAAGPFMRGQPGMMELYVSSYTPNLTTLILAREYQASGRGSSLHQRKTK